MCSEKSKCWLDAFGPVIRGLAGNYDIVYVGLAETGCGDLDKPGLLMEFLNGGGPGIAHTGTQTAEQLVNHLRDRAAVGHLALNALWYQFAGFAVLEIAVAGALFHGTDGTHAAIAFVFPTLVEEGVPWGLIGAGKQRANHH